MDIKLFDKEGSATTSPVYFAYLILKVFKRRRVDTLSIYSLGKALKEHTSDANLQQFFYGLIILKLLGIIEIDDGIYLRVNEHASIN